MQKLKGKKAILGQILAGGPFWTIAEKLTVKEANTKGNKGPKG